LLQVGGVSAERQATKLVSACSADLSDSDAPVLEPLRAALGDESVDLLVAFLTQSAAGKLLLSSDGSTCLANLDGEALGQALVESAAVASCAAALEIASIPFVQYAIGNLTDALSDSGSGSDGPTEDFIEGLGLVGEGEVEDFCALYVSDLVPCLRSQILPSLATLRSTSSGGCCDAWEDESVELFGYTLTGQFAKLAQLAGDVLCATQTPAFNGTGSQRCGYTFLQSSGELANSTSAERSVSFLEDLEVPTDQACYKAEGEAYNDTAGAAVASDEFSTSGCVVTLDRFATWVDGLPLADNSSNSYGIDLQTLFGAGECVDGADVFPVVQDFFPASIQDVVSAYFAKACLHVPIKYADGCSFARPASLVDWNYEPARASQAGSSEAGESSSALNSLNTVPPNVTDSSSSCSLTPASGAAAAALLLLLAGW
ncbi:hypothetical protein BBJ28_00019132, partial [Nothophytophthora sp. Chile5]